MSDQEEVITTVFTADLSQMNEQVDAMIEKVDRLNKATAKLVPRKYSTLAILAAFTVGFLVGLFGITMILR